MLAAGIALGGCGSPDEVTYVDPNVGDGAQQVDGSSAEPFSRFGAATTERAKAAIRIRAALGAARTLAGSDQRAASDSIDRTIEEDLPLIEPRLHANNPILARQLRTGLESLRDHPPANPVAYTREVRRITDGLLAQATDVVVPNDARQDAGFQAGLLYETLQDSAVAYEVAFNGGSDTIEDPASYRLAYGLLVDADTRQLEAVPENNRAFIRATLDRVSRSSMPGPTPPDDPRSPDTVVGEVSTLGDDVVRAAHIDPTYPSPDPATPDQLRALKRSVAAAVEAWERGERDAARRQLNAADRTQLSVASAGIAAVSPNLLAQLERDIAMTLPDAMQRRGDVAAAAAETDARIDEATQLVEEELELLRESG